MAQDQIARARAARRSPPPVAARPAPPRAARGSGRARSRSSFPLRHGEAGTSVPVRLRRAYVSFDLHVEQPRRRLGALERLEVRVRGRDHVAAAVAVEPHGPDRLARPAGTTRPGRRPGTRAPCRAGRSASTRPVGSGPGSAVRKRIASGWLNCGSTSSSGSSSPSAIRSCTSTRSTPTASRTRSAIWPPGMRAAHSTTIDPAVGRGDQLRERDARLRARARARCAPRPLRLLELCRRRSSAGRRGSSRRRSRSRAAAAGRRASAGSPRRRARSRSRSSRCRRRTPRGSPRRSATRPAPRAGARRSSSSDSTRKTPRWPPESAGFSTAGNPTSSAARRVSASVRTRGEARLRHARVGEPPPHRDLVRHQVRRLDADPRQPARLGDRGDDRHGAVGADREHAVEAEPLPSPSSTAADVGEVDDLGDVGLREPERVGVAVDRGDARSRSSFACRIARRWWRPAPTKRTVFTARCYWGAIAALTSSSTESTSTGVPGGHVDGDPVEHEPRETSAASSIDMSPRSVTATLHLRQPLDQLPVQPRRAVRPLRRGDRGWCAASAISSK